MKSEFEESDELNKKMHLRGKTEKKEDTDKVEKVKSKASETKEDVKVNLNKAKDQASETKEDVKDEVNKAKDQVSEEKEKLEKESKKEGMTPAEKVINDIITKFREGANSVTDYATDSGTKKEISVNPLIDVIDRNDSITVIADLPNVKKEDIDIGISKNSVDIQAKFKDKPDDDGAKFIQKERNYGTIHRKIDLKTEIKVKESKAKYENCTLTLELPKMVEDITKINID